MQRKQIEDAVRSEISLNYQLLDMQKGTEKHETVKKKRPFLLSLVKFLSLFRSCDLLSSDIMETTAIFIGWQMLHHLSYPHQSTTSWGKKKSTTQK